MTADEESTFGKKIKDAKTDKERTAAQDAVIERHLRLVVHIGKNYQHRLQHDEIMAIGSLALTQAIRRWDPDKGGAYRWSHRWITTALTKAVDASRVIRLPESVANEAALLAARMDEIEQTIGRKLSQTERAEIAGTRPTFATLPSAMASIEEPVHDDSGAPMSLREVVPDDNAPDPHEQLQKAETIGMVSAALNELEPIEQEVIRIRFAFGGEERETLANLGKRFKVSAEAMRRIEMSALAKLRHPANPIDLEGMA